MGGGKGTRTGISFSMDGCSISIVFLLLIQKLSNVFELIHVSLELSIQFLSKFVNFLEHLVNLDHVGIRVCRGSLEWNLERSGEHDGGL